MNFMGMGPAELVLVLVIAVIVLGPGKLPEVARALGKTMREFRSVTDSFQSELRKELDSTTSQVKSDVKPLREAMTAVSSVTNMNAANLLNPTQTQPSEQAAEAAPAESGQEPATDSSLVAEYHDTQGAIGSAAATGDSASPAVTGDAGSSASPVVDESEPVEFRPSDAPQPGDPDSQN